MFLYRNRRIIMNIFYAILGMVYAYFAYDYIFTHYEVINVNFGKIMITSAILFGVYYLAAFLYFKYISKSDFWEDRFSKTTFVTMINFVLIILVKLFIECKSFGEAISTFGQLLIITMIPALVVWSVVFLISNKK